MKLEFEKDKILLILLVTDGIFIILHILYIYTDLINSSLYSLSRDRGYAEFFQYTKELWVAVLFLILGFKKRHGLYFTFSLLFTYLLMDDSFMIHEGLGRLLADIFRFQSGLGLRAVDFGEILVSAIFGLLFLTAIVLFFIISDQYLRRVAIYLFGMFILLASFGVVMDMIEVIVENNAIARILAILEEGGEMIVMSIITWFVMRLNFNHDGLPLNWLPIKSANKREKS